MPPHRTLALTEEERALLVDLRDHAPLPYLRERAAAFVKIADGMRPAEVTRSGLLCPRDPDTVSAWLNRGLAEGLDGLAIRDGRGHKPACFPSRPDGGSRAGGDPAPDTA